MKILFIAPYMTNNNVVPLSQCKAGFGYMVYDIAVSVAKKEYVDALLYNYRYDDFKSDNVVFIGCSWVKYLKNIFKGCSPVLPLKLYSKYHMQMRTFVRLCYGWMLTGYYRDVIKNGGYDVVHIHGCVFMNEYFIDICKKLNMPFIVTLHGLNSFSDSVKLELAGKRYEKDFLKETLDNGYNITVISSGIKRTIMEHFHAGTADNIRVINNAFTFANNVNVKDVDIRNLLSIPSGAKILLYVGNVCERKNQKQIIEAYNLLRKEEKEKLYILFLGRDIEPKYAFDTYIKKQEYKEHFKVCGNVDKEYMPLYYKSADCVVLLSYSEGFGLSLIEALHFGIPCMSFDFIDAYHDIYDVCSMIGLHDSSNETVAQGLHELISRDWDIDAIRQHSKRFTVDVMSDNYIETYLSLC